jgi:hypothetical protein
MSYDGRFRNRQPKTQTSKLTCDFLTTLSERIKNCRESVRLNSNAGVRNLDENQARLVAQLIRIELPPLIRPELG